MSIDIKTVKKLAQLARLEITDEEAIKLAGELGPILEYVGQIDGALTDEDIEVEHLCINTMREDKITTETGFYTESLVALAPKSESNFVKVKKIL